MKGFEHYDLQGWLENGLSYHPEPMKQSPNQPHRARGYITKMTIPLIGVAIFGMIDASLARSETGLVTLQPRRAAGHDQFPIAAQSSFSVIVDTRSRAHAAPLAVDNFEVQTAALIAEIRAGALKNVPDETLTLAAAVAGRHAEVNTKGEPAWVEKVAGEVAQLTD